MERERLREIALEFKQSGAFSSITQQSQSALLPEPQLSVLPSFPMFNSFPALNIMPVVNELQQPPAQPKELSQAYLEAVAASQRIAASKNFTEMFHCQNSNDSSSNGPTNSEKDSNSSKLKTC